MLYILSSVVLVVVVHDVFLSDSARAKLSFRKERKEPGFDWTLAVGYLVVGACYTAMAYALYMVAIGIIRIVMS